MKFDMKKSGKTCLFDMFLSVVFRMENPINTRMRSNSLSEK